ncbi:MAG: RICIN domain-containing protein [Haloarculaceae archaeon]
MSEHYETGSGGINRRELLKYGGGALASGFVLSEVSDEAQASHGPSADLAAPVHPANHDASGLLYGLSNDGSAPGDVWLESFDHGLQVGGGARIGDGGYGTGTDYAARWDQVEQQYQRVTNPPHNAEYCIRMSDLWGADATQADSDPHPGDNGDWSTYYDFLDQVMADIDAAGMARDEIQYEIWNEPDLDLFWPRPRSQYWEMWQRGVNYIRDNHPNARIVGPGHTHYDRTLMSEWLDMTVDTGTEPDILNWHDLQTGDDAVNAANEIRDLLSQRGLGGIPLEINEYVPDGLENPGYTAWDLARVEKSDVDYAALANWQYCCSTPALCATLEEDGSDPNGRWWLYNRYGRSRGDVVASTTDGSIDSAANVNPEGTQSRVIVGNNGYSGTVEFTLHNVDQIDPDRVRIKVERMPDQEPLGAPIVDQDYSVAPSGSDTTVTLDWSTETDAFVITVTPATPSLSDGTYYVEAAHSGKYLEVANAGTQNGDNVRQYADTGCSCQQWNVTNVGDSIYRFENVNSGKVMDVEGVSTDNGANVFQWDDVGGDNQRFYVEETRSGVYRIEAAHSGKVVDVEGASTSDGANVHQWPDRSEDQQRWRFIPV